MSPDHFPHADTLQLQRLEEAHRTLHQTYVELENIEKVVVTVRTKDLPVFFTDDEREAFYRMLYDMFKAEFYTITEGEDMIRIEKKPLISKEAH